MKIGDLILEIERLHKAVYEIFSDKTIRSQNELDKLSLILASCSQALAVFNKYDKRISFASFILGGWERDPRDVEIISNLFIENPDYNTWTEMTNNYHIVYRSKIYKLDFVDKINIVGFTVNKIIRIRYKGK
jgi:hypothetical protein